MNLFIRLLENCSTFLGQLLGKQVKTIALFGELLTLIRQQIVILQQLEGKIDRTAVSLEQNLINLFQDPLLHKQDVMKLLGISDSTYRRYVEEGDLNPMGFGKVDWYFKWDLHQALEKSRRKGKI